MHDCQPESPHGYEEGTAPCRYAGAMVSKLVSLYGHASIHAVHCPCMWPELMHALQETEHSSCVGKSVFEWLHAQRSAVPGVFCFCSCASGASRGLALGELCHSLVADGVLSLFCSFHSCTGCSNTADSICNACTRDTAAQHLRCAHLTSASPEVV